MTTEPVKQILRNEHTYNFGTRGLTISDLEFIGLCLNRYGVTASYDADNTRFSTLESFLEHVKSNECKSIFWMGRTSHGNLLVMLSVIGAISTWSVEKPQENSPNDWAISQQLFNDVRDRLKQRRDFIPDIPWHIARNSIVWVPLLLLFLSSVFHISYLDDLVILQVTIAVAIMHYGFAWVDRRRWYRTAIARPNSVFSRLAAKWPEITITIFASILSLFLSELLKRISE